MTEDSLTRFLEEMGLAAKPQDKAQGPRSETPEAPPQIDRDGWYKRGEECPF